MRFILYLFLSVSTVSALAGRSIESTSAIDGATGYEHLILYTADRVSAGVTVKLTPGESPAGVAGLNTEGFSIGHLGDTGLASEVRNPGISALSRLAENTFYSADLRSDSYSRFGVGLMHRENRAGVVWEHREEIDAGIIWCVPVSLERWSLELLGEAGLLRNTVSAESWYTDEPWRSDGPFGISAVRLRFAAKRLTLGASFIASGGSSLRPGWLSAFAVNYASGPLRLRSRFVYSTPCFRNADGRNLEESGGAGFDIRYRPSRGLQISAEYEGGFTPQYKDETGAALGWRFGETQVSFETYWNRLFSDSDPELPACRRVKSRLVWDRGYYHAGITGVLEPGSGWSVKLEYRFPVRESWLIESLLLAHREKGPLLYDIKIKGTWETGDNKFIVSVYTGDLLRDWKHGPLSSGDFLAELRWLRKLAR